MRATRLNRPAAAAVFAMAALLAAGAVFAQTPNPTSAVLHTRIFNDCPISVLTTTNTYPSLIMIDDDMDPACLGFANRHNWSFSVDGVDPVDFPNNSNFHYDCDFVLSGDGLGEAGLRVSSWWTLDVDGVFMCNGNTGEIACFGGRLPFYSFTVNHGISYTMGTVVHLGITYLANDLSMANPATIKYDITLAATPYTSGPINFDQGNPAEDPPHGQWGMLQPTWVGGYLQAYAGQSNGGTIHTEWRDITFVNMDEPSAVSPTTWGHVKGMYQ